MDEYSTCLNFNYVIIHYINLTLLYNIFLIVISKKRIDTTGAYRSIIDQISVGTIQERSY